MAARIYRLTAAGREAWEGEDAAVPADYRRILWMMDLHGSAPRPWRKCFRPRCSRNGSPSCEELGMIELVPEGEGREDDFSAGGAETTLLSTARSSARPAKEAGAALARTGAYLAADRLRRRPARSSRRRKP